MLGFKIVDAAYQIRFRLYSQEAPVTVNAFIAELPLIREFMHAQVSGQEIWRIAREEIFGPVLCVIPFSTEEKAIQMANDSEYGLSTGVYTRDVALAFRVAKALRTGSVGINGTPFCRTRPTAALRARASAVKEDF